MDANLPLVSIITPSFNQGKYIEDTLLSVKNQDYPFIEHIIIDGDSKDSTTEILSKYEGSYNISWISERDSGPVEAINKGFIRAKGTIIAWINSDDYYLTDHVISTMVNYFNTNVEIQVISGNGYHVNESKKILRPIITKKELINLEYMKIADFILQPSTFFRFECIKQVSLKNSCDYVFDWLFFLELLEKKFNFMVVDDFWSAYRIHEAHRTGSNTATRKREIAKMARRNFGLYHPQTVYCYGIFFLYSVSEKIPPKAGSHLKASVDRVNSHLSKITNYRLYSC
jgi:glycosyltransferase involved in cell wall biosynthesis